MPANPSPPQLPGDSSALLAEVTGKHQSKTSEDVKIGNSLTPEQLDSLDACGHTKSKGDLLQLARIADESHRASS